MGDDEGYALTKADLERGFEAIRNWKYEPPFTPDFGLPDDMIIHLIRHGYKFILHPDTYRRIKDKLLAEEVK